MAANFSENNVFMCLFPRDLKKHPFIVWCWFYHLLREHAFKLQCRKRASSVFISYNQGPAWVAPYNNAILLSKMLSNDSQLNTKFISYIYCMF